MIEIIRKFAKDNDLSEETVIMVFREALYLAAKKKFPESESFFDVENDKYYSLSSGKYSTSEIGSIGRLFLTVNFHHHFLFLLNKLYPEKFTKVADLEEASKEVRDANESHPDDGYESCKWGEDYGGEQAYIAFWNTD